MFEIKIDEKFWNDVILNRRRFIITERKKDFEIGEKIKFFLDSDYFLIVEISYIDQENFGLYDNFTAFGFLVDNIVFGGEN